MFSIQIQRTYKYSFIITRNRREIARFRTKKEARDYIYHLYNVYRSADTDSDFFNYSPSLLTGGNSMVVYSSTKRTLGYNHGEEFKDNFQISRVVNY